MWLRALGTIAVAVVVFQGSPPAVRNGGFEDAPSGGGVPGWSLPAASTAAGYSAKLTDEHPNSGTRAAVLARDQEVKAAGFGNLIQTLDAAPFRDRRITLRASVRTAPGSRAQLWMRVDRPAGVVGFLDNMGDRPIVSPAWAEYRIQANVDHDATAIVFGLMLPGEGKAWLDDVAVESVALTIRPPAPPHALAGRALDNVIAFTKLLGYVRYFHPSDEAARADWETFAIEGVTAAEGAGSPEALARQLQERFRPVAPTLRVFTGVPPPLPPELRPSAEGRRLVTWKHRGVGVRPGQVYSSERVTDTATEAKVQIVDLGAGVKAALPLAVWSDGDRTLPRTDAAPSQPISTSAADRATRLAAVAIAWNVFQHFYPYFDVVTADWPRSLRSALAAAAENDEAAFEVTLQRLVMELHDGHGRVRPGVRPESSFLPLAWDWIEEQLVVTAVAAGTTGVQRGDVVKSIDGRLAVEHVTAAERLISGATPQWKRYRALQEVRSGPEGEVTLSLATEGGAARDLRLRRKTGPPPEDERPEKIAEVRPGIFYVDPSRLSDQEFNAALPQLVHARGVIFEMRGYPRMSPVFIQRLIASPVQSAQWLVPIITRPDREGVTWDPGGRWNLVPLAPRISAPVAFVTDGRAISYAESCMGIVEHYKLGEIVGAPTAGTNGNVNPFTVPGGYTIMWTGMKVLKHDGSRHHGVGILPTIPVSRTIKGVRAGHDELLERAIAAVTRGKSSP